MGCNAWHVPMLHAKAECCASDLSWLVSRPKLIQQYCRSAKGSRHAKAVGGHFELAVWIDVTSINKKFNMSCFFTVIKTVSISCNWTDQLLFTYKMALCTSHSHSFVCGWNIVIKFTYLTDIYTLPLTDENYSKICLVVFYKFQFS